MNQYQPDATITARIQQFANLFQKGMDAWLEAGELLVSILDEQPHAREFIATNFPTISPRFLTMFEMVGRHILHHRLLFDDCPGARKLARLPYSLQQVYIDTPLEMVVTTGDNATDVLLVSFRNLSADQAEQVFNLQAKEVRSQAAQKAWLASRHAEATADGQVVKAQPASYQIVKRGSKSFAVLYANTEFDVAGLKRLLSIMQSKDAP